MCACAHVLSCAHVHVCACVYVCVRFKYVGVPDCICAYGGQKTMLNFFFDCFPPYCLKLGLSLILSSPNEGRKLYKALGHLFLLPHPVLGLQIHTITTSFLCGSWGVWTQVFMQGEHFKTGTIFSNLEYTFWHLRIVRDVPDRSSLTPCPMPELMVVSSFRLVGFLKAAV